MFLILFLICRYSALSLSIFYFANLFVEKPACLSEIQSDCIVIFYYIKFFWPLFFLVLKYMDLNRFGINYYYYCYLASFFWPENTMGHIVFSYQKEQNLWLLLCFGSNLNLLFHWIAKWQKSHFRPFSPCISWIISIQIILIKGKYPSSNYLLTLWYSLHW